MTTKQMIAIKQIENGVPEPKAMLIAGYAKSTTKQYNRLPRDLVEKAKKNFAERFCSTIQKKFPGNKSADRLVEIASDRNDNFTAVAAIKEIHRVMSQNDKNNASINIGVFVVPQQIEGKTWQAMAKNVIDVQMSKLDKSSRNE